MPIARLAEERQKRNKYLQQKVHETLALQAPGHPALLKTCQHGTYPLSAEEEKASVRQYQEKLRTNRILQVRAQEMLFASQRVEEFRDRKTKDKQKLLNHLKEVWRENQRRRIASLEEEFVNSCQSIGLSHDAALLVERDRAAKGDLLAKQAEESRCWDTLRFEEAMQKEREQKEMREKVEGATKIRRKIVESVSNIERSLAHRYNHGPKPKPPERSDVQRDCIRAEKARKAELDRLYNERKLERGNAAASKLMNDQRIALLEQEVEEALKEEEQQADRVYTAQLQCRRSSRAGREKRPVYIKHKISYPLSCPGSVNEESSIQMDKSPMMGVMAAKPLQGHLVAITEMPSQRKEEVGVKGGSLQDLKLDVELPRQDEIQHVEPDKLEGGSEIITLKFGKLQGLKVSQRDSADGRKVIAIQPMASKSSHGSPPLDAKRERKKFTWNVSAAGEDGSGLLKLPVVKYTCQPQRQNQLEKELKEEKRVCLNSWQKEEEEVVDLPASEPPVVTTGLARRDRERIRDRKDEIPLMDSSIKGVPLTCHDFTDSVREDDVKELRSYHRKIRSKKTNQRYTQNADLSEKPKSQVDSKSVRPPFISSGIQGYRKIHTLPMSARGPRVMYGANWEREWAKAASNVERASVSGSATDNPKAAGNNKRASITDSVKENFKEDVYRLNDVSPSRERVQFPPLLPLSGLPGGNKQTSLTSRSWPHPARSLGDHFNSQEQQNALKILYGTHQRTNDKVSWKWRGNQQFGRRPQAEPGINWEVSSRRSWDLKSGSRDRILNDFYGSEIFDDRNKDVFKRGDSKKLLQKQVKDLKPVRHKAVWKSYMDEPGAFLNLKKNKEKVDYPHRPLRSVRSEPSSPPPRMKSGRSPICHQETSRQGDTQSETGFPKRSRCYTPACSVKSSPELRSRNARSRKHSESRKSPKDPNLSRLGFHAEALKGISSRIKSLSQRFHSPVREVLPENTSWRRTQIPGPLCDTYCSPTESSKQKDHARLLSEINIRRPVGPLDIPNCPDAHLSEVRRVSKDIGSKSAQNVAEGLLKAWRTGESRGDFIKAMERAKWLTGEVPSSELPKGYPGRNYEKPWLSRSPSMRSPHLTKHEPHHERHEQPQRSSPLPSGITCKSPSTSHPKTKSPQDLKKVINKPPQSPLLIERSGRSERKRQTSDRWEGQSLDFVLGSLSDQVRELDERLRSATASSPTLSSPPSLGRKSPSRGGAVIATKPHYMATLQEKVQQAPHCQENTSPSSSVASSPERGHRKGGSRTTRNVQQTYTNGRAQDYMDNSASAGRPEGSVYMDDLKTLLREISNDYPSPPRTLVINNAVRGRKLSTKGNPFEDKAQQRIERRPESRKETTGNGSIKVQVKTGFDPQFVSSTSISANSSGALSQDSLEVSYSGTNMIRDRSVKRAFDEKRESAPRQVAHAVVKERLEKRILGTGRAPQQVAQDAHDIDKVTKTSEIGNVPHQVSHNGYTLGRDTLQQMQVDKGWTHQEIVQKDLVRMNLDKKRGERVWIPHGVGLDHQNQVRNDLKTRPGESGLQSLRDPHDSHDVVRKSVEMQIIEGTVEGDTYHIASDEHRIVTESADRKTLQNGNEGKPSIRESLDWKIRRSQEDQGKNLKRSGGSEKLKDGKPVPKLLGDSPLWGQVRSPLSPGDWRKLGLTLDEAEEQLLLSGSIDFSPWNTEQLPDIILSQSTKVEDKVVQTATKPSSPAGKEAAQPNWSAKNLRPKPELNHKQFTGLQNSGYGSNPRQQRKLQSTEFSGQLSPVAFKGSLSDNASQVRPRHLGTEKRPKAGARGGDALWALSGRDTSPELCVISRSIRETKQKIRKSASSNSRRLKGGTSSSSWEEMPDSTSKSSQDDNCTLPVVMAKDDASRREVIERRKKARQLDMEHRLRLSSRVSRPTSARSCA